jgi:hypothetical protein
MAVHGATTAPGKEDVGAEEKDEVPHPVEDLISGAIFMVVGVGAFIMAMSYPTGSMHRMGPGLFPLLVSGLMAVIGAALALQAVAAWRLRSISDAPALIPNFATVRALGFVMLSLLTFALLIRPAGLIIAISLLAFICTRAEPGRPIVGSIILSLFLACLVAVIFVYGIGLPIPLWP